MQENLYFSLTPFFKRALAHRRYLTHKRNSLTKEFILTVQVRLTGSILQKFPKDHQLLEMDAAISICMGQRNRPSHWEEVRGQFHREHYSPFRMAVSHQGPAGLGELMYGLCIVLHGLFQNLVLL